MCEYRGGKPPCAVNAKGIFVPKVGASAHHRPTMSRPRARFECEQVCWDPKDGELCLNRAKPGETLVEARSDSDVQIDRQIWV